MELLLSWTVFGLIIMAILVLFTLLDLYRRLIMMIEVKLVNEWRMYVSATGEEAYAFAESIQPEASAAKKLETAVDYMRRQFQQRKVAFDYEQARAVIERAAVASCTARCRSFRETEYGQISEASHP